ncbi:MAG: FAD-dependent oxidoreductase, partial [Sulfuritalea sp.]|nr:FAD-dependent oxidoreductase [Sulfuritalea sp.]
RELIDGIKQATPDNPLSVRLNGAELMDRWGGNTQDESFELMQQAVDCGVDMISVTVGWQEAPESSFGRDVEPGYWNFLSEKAKKMFPNVLVAFGNRLPDPAMANDCVKNEVFDYWEVCRPLLADPEMIHKAAEDRMEEVRPCIGSLNCLSRLFRDLPYTCTMNPMLGHEVEPEYHVTEATEKKRIMIIGAGPAGMEAAITARRRGHSVTVFDKSDKMGGNLAAYAANDLARPADLQSVIDYYGVMAKKLGVEVRLNTEANAKFMRSVLHEYDVCIVAAGARTDMEVFQYLDGADLLVDALDVAHGRVKPGKRVVMIGGGKIGLTISEFLAKAGHEVTVVEKEKRIGGDIMPTFKWRHTAWVDELGIKTVTLAHLVKVTAEGATVKTPKGEQFIPCDSVLVSSPRKANHDLFHEFQWMVDELHGGGDATVPRGLDQAIQEGYRLGVRI